MRRSFTTREEEIDGRILTAHKLLDPKMEQLVETRIKPVREQCETNKEKLIDQSKSIAALQETLGNLTPETIEILKNAGKYEARMEALEKGAGWLSVVDGVPCCTFEV